jgi:hypothetical protein
MGISVSSAYRLKKSKDFWPLVSDIQKVGTLKTKAALNEFFLGLMGAVEVTSEAYLKYRAEGLAEGPARARIAEKLMRDGYKASNVSSSRDPFDFNVWVSFRHFKRRIYVFPGCDMMLRNVLDFLAEDPRLEEFWYDNRGDKPDELTQEEWNKRAKVWEKLAYAPEYESALHLDVSKWDMWWKMNPYMDQSLSSTIRGWGDPEPSSMAKIVKSATPKG